MSQLCFIQTCKSKSSALCYCCNRNVCSDHLKEHDDWIKSRLNVYNDDVLNLIEELKLFDTTKLVENSREKLNLWKEKCYQMIDSYYEQKCQELQQFTIQKIDQHQKGVDQIQTTIIDLIRSEKATQKNLQSLKFSIEDIRRQMKKFEEKGIQMDIRPFILDNHTISIKDSKPHAFHLNPSNLLSSKRTIDCADGSQSELATNDRFILINLGKNLCLLDQDLVIIKQSPWVSECIYDMCWSSTSSNFILITNRRKVYRVNETTLLTDRIFAIEEKDWLSCTCSDTHLYLTTREIGTNIYQFKLSPLIRPVKQWIPPYSCKPHESIHDIQYNNGTIALIIRESFGGAVDIELRSSATLSRIWSLPLDIRSPGIWSRISCRSLPYDEWFIVHTATSRLFHVDKDGKLKVTLEYQSKLHNATLFGSGTLVMHLGTKVQVHKL